MVWYKCGTTWYGCAIISVPGYEQRHSEKEQAHKSPPIPLALFSCNKISKALHLAEVSLISLIEKVTKLSSALAGAGRIEHPLVVLETTVLPLNYTPTLAGTPRVELGYIGSKPIAFPLCYAPMTTPPFYSEERWGLYHALIISQIGALMIFECPARLIQHYLKCTKFHGDAKPLHHSPFQMQMPRIPLLLVC